MSNIFNKSSFYIIVIAGMFIYIIASSVNNLQIKNVNSNKSNVSYSIFISIEDNRLYLLKNGKLFKSYPCATGKNDTPSPAGFFRIVKKSHWGEGFGGSWLKINCPWGEYGIHGTLFPDTVGYPLSHGCFRMLNNDVEKLYKIVPVGTPVLISGGCYRAFGDGFREIGPGMYGYDVMTVQLKLKYLGYYNGRCNGSYNASGFMQSIHNFQKVKGLTVTNIITEEMYNKLGFLLMD